MALGMSEELTKTEKLSLGAGVLCAAVLLGVMWRFEPGTAFWATREALWLVCVNLGLFLVLKKIVPKAYLGQSGWIARLTSKIIAFNKVFALFSVAFVVVVCLVEFLRK